MEIVSGSLANDKNGYFNYAHSFSAAPDLFYINDNVTIISGFSAKSSFYATNHSGASQSFTVLAILI